MYQSGGIPEILAIQANRFPMLFIDRFERLSDDEVRCWKNFTYNEWFFPPHFPGNPNVPGFILFEALTQALLLAALNDDDFMGSETLFIGADKVKFRRIVRPGETMQIDATIMKSRRGVISGKSKATIDGELVCSAELTVGVEKLISDVSSRLKGNSESK